MLHFTHYNFSSHPVAMNTNSNPNRLLDRTDKRQPESIQHKVMKSVCEYNRQLNQERKEDRRVCMDLQTYTIQYPVGLGRENKGLRRWVKRRRRISPLWRGGRRYPVALLPTQYQDWFLHYSSNDLKYFPLNTVTYGSTVTEFVPDKSPPLFDVSNGNNSDSEMDGSDVLSDLDDDSSCSCGEEHCSPLKKNGLHNSEAIAFDSNNTKPDDYNENSCPPKLYSISTSSSLALANSCHLNKSMPNLTSINGSNAELGQCKVCKKDIFTEEVLRCADCGIASHPPCLDIGGELLDAIRLYKWQCMDCKSCNQCGHPHDEAKMMFCDKCDRGYHTYCVGLTDIPDGHWVCAMCAFCANCGTKKVSENSGNVDWHHELIKIHSPDGETLIRHQVFCETCNELRKL